MDEVVEGDGEGVEGCEEGIEEELEKVLLISNPHTVVHPRAVVVHFYDTPIAHLSKNPNKS